MTTTKATRIPVHLRVERQSERVNTVGVCEADVTLGEHDPRDMLLWVEATVGDTAVLLTLADDGTIDFAMHHVSETLDTEGVLMKDGGLRARWTCRAAPLPPPVGC
jgi:hypothetical protein